MSQSDDAQAPLSLEEWVATLAAELGVPELADLDLTLVLDLARDAAHGVARPAAPLTTFLVGYAAGKQGADAVSLRRLASDAARLATSSGHASASHTAGTSDS